ncbi:MAG: glutaredoxin family protein [Myxococcota bacterium]|nr:glutaredoxin family protein [Myxococcota bacterium]
MRPWLSVLLGLGAFAALWLAPTAKPPDRGSADFGRALVAASGEAEVVVYSRPACGWCRKTMAWLDEHEVEFDDRDIEACDESREQLRTLTGRGHVPVVLIGGELVEGFDPMRMREILARAH